MYIEITPTTQLPAFEAYLDGNGGTETADGNDNGINQATQFTYLDGNFTPIPSTVDEVYIFWQDHAYDNTVPTELTYNFPRKHPALVAQYIDGIQSQPDFYFDGNNGLVTNTMYHIYEGDGYDTLLDGNAPSREVTDVTVFGININNILTGDALNANYVFRFPQLIRLQADGSSVNNHIHFGPLTEQNETKPLSANIAFVEGDFDNSIDTHALVVKRGIFYPDTLIDYTDITGYHLVSVSSLFVIKGDTLNKVDIDSYQDKYGTVTNGAPRLLIVDSSYDDGNGNVYDEAGNVVDQTYNYITIGFDPDFTGTKSYLYSKAVTSGLPETDNTSTIILDGHEEYQLKGIIMYESVPYWAVMQYISRGFYAINSLAVVTEDLNTIRNKDLFASIEFNKELTN